MLALLPGKSKLQRQLGRGSTSAVTNLRYKLNLRLENGFQSLNDLCTRI
jgi:hypothetical protein